jgi:ribosomal protein S27AE
VAELSPQRAYRAACPGCGAPVEFRSAASTYAVCGFCQSTLVRTGEALSRVGKMAELFDDFSPLQLGTSGKYNNKNFSLVGRLQYKYPGGTWNEWYAWFDDAQTAWLSEDNGAYVWMQALPITRALPEAPRFIPGSTTAINGQPFNIASVEQVSLMAAQGELPRLPALGVPFFVVDLRSEQGDVISLDYAQQPPSAYKGRAVTLDELQCTGLREDMQSNAASSKELKAQNFNCPNCGASVSLALASTQNVTCSSCHSIIDVSQGLGGQLAHTQQEERAEPIIELGSSGTLQGKQWQVVGFLQRMGRETSDPDETFSWCEYLLYNRKAGFQFLVDATDGWSLVKPVTGAPTVKGSTARYLNNNYNLQYSYNAEATYVAGEFYWNVMRGQTTFNQDYIAGKSVLSREQAGSEITWSLGAKLSGQTVAAAFKIKDRDEAFKREDVTPLTQAASFDASSLGSLWIWIFFIVFIFVLVRCDNDCDPQVENCSSSRSSGGSYGGYSSGGGHK